MYKFRMDKSKNRTKSTRSLTNCLGGSTANTFDCLPSTDCPHCHRKLHLTLLIPRALFIKYAASQNYYYQKDINNILNGQRSKAQVLRKEWTYLEAGEYLKRYYIHSEFRSKNIMLTEYYKFHRDVPRIFMLPSAHTLSKYHNKRRRIDYVRITKMLGGQVDQHSPTAHSIPTSLNNILGQINLTPKVDDSHTLADIHTQLKEIINTSKCYDFQFTEPEEPKQYNMPLQIKILEQNKFKDVLSFKKQSESKQYAQAQVQVQAQTYRESSQHKKAPPQTKFSSERHQTPITQRAPKNIKQSVSPTPPLQKSVRPQIMQLIKAVPHKAFKSTTNNIILECLMKKLQGHNQNNSNTLVHSHSNSQHPVKGTNKKQQSKSPAEAVPKRKKRIMSSNHEATGIKLDLTLLKYQPQLTYRERITKTGRGSVQV